MIFTRDGNSKLVPLKHLSRFTKFTVWCWTVLGVYLAMACYCSLAFSFGWPLSPEFLLATTVAFEIAFGTSYLVTTVVTFVLYPRHIKDGVDHMSLFEFYNVLQHNANVLIVAVEFALNKVPFVFAHFPFIVFFGQLYVLFSVWLHSRIGVFYYFFLDFEAPYAAFLQLGLLVLVSSFLEFDE